MEATEQARFSEQAMAEALKNHFEVADMGSAEGVALEASVYEDEVMCTRCEGEGCGRCSDEGYAAGEVEYTGTVDSVSTYDEVGMLTTDAGIVLRMADGSKYAITVQRYHGSS